MSASERDEWFGPQCAAQRPVVFTQTDDLPLYMLNPGEQLVLETLELDDAKLALKHGCAPADLGWKHVTAETWTMVRDVLHNKPELRGVHYYPAGSAANYTMSIEYNKYGDMRWNGWAAAPSSSGAWTPSPQLSSEE